MLATGAGRSFRVARAALEAGKPALGGRLQFAGEHTAGAKHFGFMNGGVLSGNRAAKKLIEVMAPHE